MEPSETLEDGKPPCVLAERFQTGHGGAAAEVQGSSARAAGGTVSLPEMD